VYLQRQQYRPPMLPYNGPMPKHLSTVNQGNDVRVANETLHGVDMAELFNDFTKTSVHILSVKVFPIRILSPSSTR
jgi:hypothetical protein